MKALFHTAIVFALCVCVSGCAAPGASSVTSATARLAGTRSISARDVKGAIAIGKSTKADVIAALGKTTVISFDSGFEVWVYQYAVDPPAKASLVERIEHAGREEGSPGKAEFVVLFDPSGLLKKTRIRHAPRL